MGATKKANEKGQEDSNGVASAASVVQLLRLRPGAALTRWRLESRLGLRLREHH